MCVGKAIAQAVYHAKLGPPFTSLTWTLYYRLWPLVWLGEPVAVSYVNFTAEESPAGELKG